MLTQLREGQSSRHGPGVNKQFIWHTNYGPGKIEERQVGSTQVCLKKPHMFTGVSFFFRVCVKSIK